MEDKMIDISRIDKVKLLKALWVNQGVASFFGNFKALAPAFDEELAKAVKDYIDYFNGRCIKTDLSKDLINPWLYDRDAGAGTFQRVVWEFKK